MSALKLSAAGVTSEPDPDVIFRVTLRGSMEEDLPCPRDMFTLCTQMMPNDFSPSDYGSMQYEIMRQADPTNF